MLQNTGFWFAVGVIAGILISFAGRVFLKWYYRPKLTIPLQDNDVLWDVETGAEITSPNKAVDVRAFRLKVMNKGKRAADQYPLC